MGNRPIEIFLFCDIEDKPLVSALSHHLTANGIVSSCGQELTDRVLDDCQSVAVCVGENTRSLSPNQCSAIQMRLASGAFCVMVVFLPSAYREDCAWLPKNWIEFKSEDDPEALRELIAILRPSLKVFLCHSKTDKPAVRELHTLLASDGFRPWLDEKDLIAGQEWQLTIQEEVQSSQIVIVCLSPAAVNKAGFVQKEIRLALDVADLQPEGSIFLIPTRLKDCDVPIRLRKWQWVDLWTPAGYQTLLVALNSRRKELGIIVARGLTPAEVAQLTTWRPLPQGKTILFVVRNPDLDRFIKRMLEPKGWTVVTAESAQQAVEIVRMSIEAPSVALLDRNIPDANGLAIGTKLRELSPTMGIIFTSLDLPTPGDEISFEENDFYFLGKPFLAAALIRLLDQIRREARRLSKGEGTSTLN